MNKKLQKIDFKLELFTICLLFLFSCKDIKNKESIKQTTFDFTSTKFEKKSISLLNGYDVFDFQKKSDSILIMNCSIFQGWKKESRKIIDTLKLKEKYFVRESLNNTEKQILSFSNNQDVFFQLIVTHRVFDDRKKSEKDNKKELPPNENFDYQGKLFMTKKSETYFSENLWYK